MKKILSIIALAIISSTATAGGYHHHARNWHHPAVIHNPYDWVLPAIVGGFVVYSVMDNRQPVILQQQQVIVQPKCSSWIEIQQSDGTIVRQRTCSQ